LYHHARRSNWRCWFPLILIIWYGKADPVSMWVSPVTDDETYYYW
jgi:hypothetical protein